MERTQDSAAGCCDAWLDEESPMTVERYVRLIAGIVVLGTLAAGYWLSPWFFLGTAFMGANLVQSAFTNWCPMMPVLRSMGVKDESA